MRSFLTWLLVFGVLAGLNARVLAADGPRIPVCAHVEHDCGTDEGHDHGDSHEKHCPLEHHHHSGCCQNLPLTTASDLALRLSVTESALPVFWHEGEIPPDGPSIGLDKPPLI